MWPFKSPRTLKHRHNCSNQLINEIAQVAFAGTASKKVERALVVVDPNTGNCVQIHADSGLSCGNPSLAPDSLPINNRDIKGDNPLQDME